MQLANAAVVNALWDLWAKLAGQPLWKLLADMSPAEIVALVDWRYLTDALTPDEARRSLERLAPTRAAREAELRETGYPAYTTSVGWLGYSDDKIRRLCREALAAGFTRFKIKVGASQADDIRRAALVRQEIGPDGALMIDANQRWDVGPAIEWVTALAAGEAALDRGADQPGRCARPRRGAPRGEAARHRGRNRRDGVEPRRAGSNSWPRARSALLPARLLPHGGCQRGGGDLAAGGALRQPWSARTRAGWASCEYVQHASIFDYVAVSGGLERRSIGNMWDHLHASTSSTLA